MAHRPQPAHSAAITILAPLLLLAFAGCLDGTSSPDPDPVDTPATADEVLDQPVIQSHSCYGYNLIVFVDGADLRTHAPPNWTFTAPPGNPDMALLRILALGCQDEWRVILSTPMHPDDASAHHHDNPDHVIAVYTDNESRHSIWQALGARTENATIDWTEARPTHDHVVVDTENGPVMDLIALDPREPIGGAYDWNATYSAGADNIDWFHGQETAPNRRAEPGPITFGSASPFPGLSTVPWYGEAWLGFDVTYRPGPGSH